MMKTALSIIQSMRYRMGLSAPTTLVGLTDPDELQMLHLLYETCEELRQARCWPQQKRKHTLATTAARATYPLPQDFFSMLIGSQWNTDDDRRLIGPATDAEFTNELYGGAPSSENFTFRVFGHDEDPATVGGQIELSPTPAATVNVAFEYITRTFIVPATYVLPTAPKETVTADTDLVLFDDDLVTIGLRAKWIKEHGGDSASDEAQFQARIDRAVGRMQGAHIGTFGGRAGGPQYRTQYKGWSF